MAAPDLHKRLRVSFCLFTIFPPPHTSAAMAKRRLPWEDDVASSPEPLRAANRHKDGHVVASSPESDGGFELIFSSSPPYLPLRVRSASGASDDASSGDIDSGYHGASPPRCSTPYGHGESGRAPSDCNLTATEPATPSPCPSSAGGAVRVLPSAATPPDARAAAERPPDCNTSPSVVQISPSSDEFGHLDWPESDQDGVPQAGAAAEVLPAITLTPEQSEVFDQVVNNGRSVFFTGAAGERRSNRSGVLRGAPERSGVHRGTAVLARAASLTAP